MVEILGRTMISGFEALLTDVASELAGIRITYEPIEKDEELREGGSYWGRSETNLAGGTARIGLDTDLPDLAFSHTAAHELGHVLQRVRGYVQVMVSDRLTSGSQEAQAAVMLTEAIECVAVDEFVQPYGLDPTISRERRIASLRSKLASQPLERFELSNPRFVGTVLHYVRIGLESSAEDWTDICNSIKEQWPKVAEIGERLVPMLQQIGRESRKQRRESFLYLQRQLELRGKVMIYNPATQSTR